MFDSVLEEPTWRPTEDEWLDYLSSLSWREQLDYALRVGPCLETARLALWLKDAPLDAGGRVDYVTLCHRLQSWMAALTLTATHRLVYGLDGDERFSREQLASAELAPAITVSPRTADNDVSLAIDACGRLRRVHELLERGEISLRHLRVFESETCNCSEPILAQVLDEVLPVAGGLTPGRLRRRIHKVILRLDAEAVRKRRASAFTHERGVQIVELPDDMARLVWTSTKDEIFTAKAVLDRRVFLRTAADDERTAQQRRSDSMYELMLDAWNDPVLPELRGHRAWKADITVPFETIVGLSDAPGQLRAMGPIGAELARRMVDDARIRFLFYGVGDGVLLPVDPGTWRPTAALERHTIAKAHTCTFPGCDVPSEAAEQDHANPFHDGGLTTWENLHTPCKWHHLLKTHGDWKCEIRDDGVIVWTSPAGKTYYVHPPDLRPDG